MKARKKGLVFSLNSFAKQETCRFFEAPQQGCANTVFRAKSLNMNIFFLIFWLHEHKLLDSRHRQAQHRPHGTQSKPVLKNRSILSFLAILVCPRHRTAYDSSSGSRTCTAKAITFVYLRFSWIHDAIRAAASHVGLGSAFARVASCSHLCSSRRLRPGLDMARI